ncbi:HET-domain-containing protein [Apiospora aurea]|uniref:HET-domain-containing protein n=1 Tax=Apiospora aurea TaxID=335848 RepID=A0ABR1QZL6_9PEZI
MSLPNNGVATLCDDCRPALRLPTDTNGWIPVDEYYLTLVIDHQRDDEWPLFPGLEESISKTGCEFCQLLKTTLTSKEVKSDFGTLANISVTLKFKWWAPSDENDKVQEGRILRIEICQSSIFRVVVFLPVSSRSPLVTGEVARSYNLSSPIESSVLAGEPKQFIRSSLNKCSNHLHYNNTETPEFTPTRLVDALSERPRIVELNAPTNEEPQPDRRYVALSYCWGGKTQLMLTCDTEQALKEGFSKDILSATQKDTIELAKALTIPYVWIDALCIRQGDHNDWESQAKVMGKIYSGAYLTVCAASSSSCEEGYLQRDFVTPIEVPTDPVSDPSGAAGTYFFQPIRWSCNYEHIRFYHAPFSLANSKWNTRAWTFQEKMMSRRLLFFTTSGLNFNCGQYLHSEHSASPIPSSHETIPSVRDPFELEELHRMGDKSKIYHAWIQRVANKYGDRQMTRRTDAFPSLSGLAHTFASLLQDDYVAGLWKQDLARGLSWYSYKPAHNSLETLLSSFNNANPCIGPSWSWVGHGEVRYFLLSFDFVSVCQELSAECVPKGADKCGELKSASLRVRTRVYPARSGDWRPLSNGTAMVYQGPGRGEQIRVELDFKNFNQSDFEDCVLIPIGTFYYRWEPVTILRDKGFLTGLIAHPADDGVRFIRIGYFEVSRGWPVVKPTELERVLESLGECEIRDLKII